VTLLLFLAADADVGAVDTDGFTALHCASEFGQPDCVQLLINASAFIDMADKDGFTALSLAGKEGQSGCVRLLLDARASTTTFCNFGTSPLLAAVLDACTEYVRQLLDAGAQIDHRNQYGATALHLRPSYLPFHTTRTVSQLVCPTKTVSAVLDYFCSVARASTHHNK
jgi:ankyrin repeat protein